MNYLAGEVGVTVEVFPINLVVEHLPGAVNVDADAISRLKGGKEVPKILKDVPQVTPPRRDSSFYQVPRDQLIRSLHVGASNTQERYGGYQTQGSASTWRGRSRSSVLQYLAGAWLLE